MRVVLQRVRAAKVEVEGVTVGRINEGWLAMLAVKTADSEADVEYIANKILNLRGFPLGDKGRFDLSATDAKKEILLVSQFTLYADCRRGRRPSFANSASPLAARLMYEKCLQKLRDSGLKVETGVFQAMMQVSLVNDGPVTFIIDSQDKQKGVA